MDIANLPSPRTVLDSSASNSLSMSPKGTSKAPRLIPLTSSAHRLVLPPLSRDSKEAPSEVPKLPSPSHWASNSKKGIDSVRGKSFRLAGTTSVKNPVAISPGRTRKISFADEKGHALATYKYFKDSNGFSCLSCVGCCFYFLRTKWLYLSSRT